MKTKSINFEDWSRYQHYKVFAGMDSPHLTISFNIDIKPLLGSSKNFFSAMLFLIHQTCEEIPEFHYRIENDGSVMYYEDLDISFNILAKDGLFSNHRMATVGDFEEFNTAVQLGIKAKSEKGQIQIDPNQKQNLIVTSYVPWFTFTGLREPSFNKNDSIPRITWGKYTADGQLPVSIQAHHGLMDGVHVGEFYRILNEKIVAFASIKGV